jgi:hypothetical protein
MKCFDSGYPSIFTYLIVFMHPNVGTNVPKFANITFGYGWFVYPSLAYTAQACGAVWPTARRPDANYQRSIRTISAVRGVRLSRVILTVVSNVGC